MSTKKTRTIAPRPQPSGNTSTPPASSPDLSATSKDASKSKGVSNSKPYNDRYRRARERRRQEEAEVSRKVNQNSQRIKKLESQIDNLEATLKEKKKARKQGKTKQASTTSSPGEYFQKEKFFGDPF